MYTLRRQNMGIFGIITIIPAAEMGFFGILFLFLAIVFGSWAAICFIFFPLLRYIAVRTVLFFRCLFSKAYFRGNGILSFFFPHFISGKPDLFLLSGRKLYAIRLKSYRKRKSRITVLSDKKWQIESIRSALSNPSESFIATITSFFHDLTVHKRTQKAPTDLALYVKNINKALAEEPIDCVPVLEINPSVKSVITNDRIDLIDGDTVFYGVIMANSFFPKNAQKPEISRKEARRIVRLAKKQLRIKIH